MQALAFKNSSSGRLDSAPGSEQMSSIANPEPQTRRHLKGCYLVGGFDANKRLSEGHRPETTVKEEKADVGVDM